MAGDPSDRTDGGSSFFTPTVILALVIFVILITIIVYFYKSDSGLHTKIENLEKKNETLEKQVAVLSAEINRMKAIQVETDKQIKKMAGVYRDRHLINEDRNQLIHDIFKEADVKSDLVQFLVPETRNRGRSQPKRGGSTQKRRATVRTPASDDDDEDLSDSEIASGNGRSGNILDL